MVVLLEVLAQLPDFYWSMVFESVKQHVVELVVVVDLLFDTVN